MQFRDRPAAPLPIDAQGHPAIRLVISVRDAREHLPHLGFVLLH